MPIVKRRKTAEQVLGDVLKQGAQVSGGAAHAAADYARALCPVSNNNAPGHTHTRDTIRVETDEQGAASLKVGDESRDVTYARVVAIEFGTSTHAAHAFIRPAVEISKRDAQAIAQKTKPRG